MKNITVCKICNKELPKKGMGRHLKKHGVTSKYYYDKYLKKEGEGICFECGKETTFLGLSKGYRKFCSISCSRKFYAKDEEFNKKVGKKISKSWYNKSQKERDKIVEQRTKTLNQHPKEELQEICRQAAKIRWEKTTDKEKREFFKTLSKQQKEWWNSLSTEEKQKIIDKQKKSLKEYYGNETEDQKKLRSDKLKLSWKNKSEEELQEYKQLQSSIQKDIWNNLTEEEYENRCRIAIENNKKYWDNISKEDYKKRCNNIKEGCKNKKYIRNRISKNELNFINFLNENRIIFIYDQVIDDRYPFHIDFYIPKLDLFIELNVFWHHGGFPYTNSKRCKEKLNTWKEKARTSKFYENAIYTWTVRDVKKRNIAKKNKLNYIELFTEDEIEVYKLKLLEEINGCKTKSQSETIK